MCWPFLLRLACHGHSPSWAAEPPLILSYVADILARLPQPVKRSQFFFSWRIGRHCLLDYKADSKVNYSCIFCLTLSYIYRNKITCPGITSIPWITSIPSIVPRRHLSTWRIWKLGESDKVMVKSMNSATRLRGFNSVPTIYKLLEFGQIISLHCASVPPSLKWDRNNTYFRMVVRIK